MELNYAIEKVRMAAHHDVAFSAEFITAMDIVIDAAQKYRIIKSALKESE